MPTEQFNEKTGQWEPAEPIPFYRWVGPNPLAWLDYAEETVEEAREGVRSVRRNLDRAEDSLRRMDAAIEVLRQHERR